MTKRCRIIGQETLSVDQYDESEDNQKRRQYVALRKWKSQHGNMGSFQDAEGNILE